MKGLLHYIIGCVITVFLTGCIMDDVEPEVEKVNVSISVSLANAVTSRAYEDAVGDGEKMNTLRIVIVRGEKDGVVEHNRFIDLTDPVTLHGIENFQVIANETKYIYFFVNEGDTKFYGTNSFDFQTIEEQGSFPFKALEEAIIGLDEDGKTSPGLKMMPTPLPMNSMYSLMVGNENMDKVFWVTRAATKFTYIIDNSGNSEPFKLTRLEIKNQAKAEYYMQHIDDNIPVWNVETNDILNEVTTFDALNEGIDNEYLPYVADYSNGIDIPAGKEVELSPIYLAETKYFGDNYGKDDKFYETTLSFGALTHFTGKLKDLPYQLPRNTHVVVKVKIMNGEATWEVDVFPYIGVDLKPSFGL